MTASSDLYKNTSFVLRILLPLQIVFVIYAGYFFYINGHFPTPFFYDVGDTFMDFFNTNFWSLRDGRFDEWKSIYPIFVFFLAKLFISSHCIEATSAFELRSCDQQSLIFLIVPFFLGALFCCRLLAGSIAQKYHYKNWYLLLSYFLVIIFSVQGLIALERGNYLVVVFMLLALSSAYEKDWRSALFLAMAINIKQYLLILWIVPILKRRFDLLLLGLIFTGILNIIGLLFVPESHYSMLIENMLGFSSTMQISFIEKLWNPTSIAAWLRVIENLPPFRVFNNQDLLDTVHLIATITVFSSRLLIIITLSLMLLRAKFLDERYISFISLLSLLVLSDSPGGYSLILLFPFLTGILNRSHSYALCFLVLMIFIPIEIPIGPEIALAERVSFLSGEDISGITQLSVGSLIRPIILLALICYIMLDILKISTNKNKTSFPAPK